MMTKWWIALSAAALVIALVLTVELSGSSPNDVDAVQAGAPSGPLEEAPLAAPEAPSSSRRRSPVGQREPGAAVHAGPAAEGANASPPATGPLTGRVVDEAGEPVPGARVGARFLATREFSMIDLEAKKAEREVAFDVTDRSGRFSLTVPAAHPVDVDARRDGFGTAYGRGFYAGEERELVLARAATFMGRLVRADDGRPVADVSLSGWSNDSRAELFRGTSGPGGSFRFDDLPPGPLTYRVQPEGLASPDWVTLELAAGQVLERTIKLEAGIVISGRVSDASTGAPIEGAEIWEGWFGRKRVPTAADGTYRLEGFGGPGVYDIHVHAAGYGNAAHEFNYTEVPSADVELDFALQPARRARGRVFDKAGSAVEGAYVAAVHSSFRNGEQVTDWEATRTNALGQYVLPSLHPDLAHVLFVRKAGLGTVVYGFPADEFDLDVIVLPDVLMPAPARLEGTAVDEHGMPRAGVEVVLAGWNADAGSRGPGAPRTLETGLLDSYIGERQSATDSRGRFAFADVSKGSYQVRATASGGSKGVILDVEVEEGAWIRDLELVLPLGLSIAGRVLDPEGQGLAQVFMRARSEETGEQHTVMSGPGGAFQFIELKPGRYHLIAEPTFLERGDDSPPLAVVARRGVESGSTEVELVMPLAALVEGTVLGPDGAPVHGSFVFATDAGGRQVGWAVTDKSGAFSFNVAPGEPLRVIARPSEPSEESPFGFDVVGTEADGIVRHGVTAPAVGMTLQLP